MKKNKSKSWLVVLIIIFLVAILMFLINSTKSSNEDTKLNLTEKKWIENNKKEVVNISLVNDIPLFSNDGNGVFFDFTDRFEDETGLSLNLISYSSEDEVQENDLYFEVVKESNESKIKDTEMIFFKDYYVLVGKEESKITSPNEIKNKKIGVLSNDLADISYYISSKDGVSYTPYENMTSIKNALENDEVNYIAVPKTRTLSYILEKKYHIIYNITEVKEDYVLRTSKDTDKRLVSIVNKKYIEYKNNYLEKEYSKNLLELILDKNNISEKSKADFLSKRYVYGYLENEPYASEINNKLIGLDSMYINSFSDLTGAGISLKKYRSVKALKNDLNSGKVDIAPNYYNYSGLSGDYIKTISPYDEEYVVLVYKTKTDLVVNSVKSLKNIKVITINSTLSKYLEKEGAANVTSYDKVSTLIKKLNKDSIVVLDKNVYDKYKDGKLSNYRVIYNDKEGLQYGYIIKKTNENNTLSSLLTTYMETLNYKQVYNLAWKDYLSESKEVSYTFLYIIGVVILLFIIWLFASKKIKIKKKNKREETIRYVDPLTSLKNRNYLNKNFKDWENNSIYPQAIIVINLNNLRHVNDVYGHEEGDKLLKLAANILIKNQLEQSDIIRTDGNEYLVYLVGYGRTKVVAYMRKLYKELSELPYGYGATLGYSMIEDDIKTIDDAINEAVLEIRANKEMQNKKR